MDNPWATSDPWQPELPKPDTVHGDGDWAVPWGTAPTSEAGSQQWEPSRQETPVPTDGLDSLLHHCQQVSQEVWPAHESSNEGDWRSGFDDLADIAALLAQLVPADPTLPPAVQFSTTGTAKAMNEALKLTRHLPLSASSPLSRLLASKGSLEWEKSLKTNQEVVPDTVRVGWRVLEKEDRLGMVEESKPKKATGGFLSFWNRRASAIQVVPVETSGERSDEPPARSSQESDKPFPQPPSSQAASPPKPSTASVPPPPDSYPTGVVAPPAPSAVSRFLNRFSRTKSTQHSALALSSDDLEFLTDIVPSASDPPDGDINDSTLGMLTGASSSSPLPPKLPPPIPPPPKQSIMPSRRSSALGPLGDASVTARAPAIFQAQGTSHTPSVPVLAPPLSPKPAPSSLHTQSTSSGKDVTTPTIGFGQLGKSIQPGARSNSRTPPFPLSPVQKIPPLSLPPLLPPPPVSPPQTPRPNIFASIASSVHSPDIQNNGTSACNPDDFDDEFTAFTSFPSPGFAPFPSSNSYPPPRSPSPPSPPPRRSYERTHYPSSSSASSVLSPASQSSADKLYSTKSPISASLDSFDDFVSPPSVARQGNRKHTPSPPPLPAKPPSQHWQLPHLDTYHSRAQHSRTSSQTFTSPTVHTSLISSASSVPHVSNAEHQRTQALVNHAAARGGLLWPNSPVLDDPVVKRISPPPSMSPPPITLESFDLLGDGDDLGFNLDALPPQLNEVGGIGTDFVSALRAPSRVADGPGRSLGLRQRQLSPPPLPFASAPVLSSASLGMPHFPTATNASLLPPTKPKQMGGLSAQDLSFFEGL